MKKILFAGSECMPFAATGGLGDVLGSLPAAVKKAGGDDVDVRVVLPLYSAVGEEWRAQMETVKVFEVELAWRRQYCGILSLEKDGVIYYFVDNEYYFKRDSLYGHYDDGERYAFFSKAVVEMMQQIDYFPDILHANDWQSALSVIYLNLNYRQNPGYEYIKTVFTIHNIEYQGKYDMALLNDLFGIDWKYCPIMEWGGCMNLMKAAIECADRVTTVSERYAGEIQNAEYAHGLENALQKYSYKLSGILNGIDYDFYDPHTDEDIAKKYTMRSAYNKPKNKTALQQKLCLPETDAPMFAIISRLVSHKGMDLVREIAYKLVEENDVQLIILGTGDSGYEGFFRELEMNHHNQVRSMIMYNRKLSKLIYAASDFLIMPSKSEPCGLSQMIASRYGSVPVVRETGGLYDSIKGYWVDEGEIRGNGFTFYNYSSDELYDRLRAAISVYNDTDAFKKLRRKVMSEDFSWNNSAVKYLEMYNSIN